MEKQLEERILGIMNEYRENNVKYMDLMHKLESLKSETLKLEQVKTELIDELTSIRAKEMSLMQDVQTSGIDLSVFNSEMTELIKKLTTNG